MSQKLHDQFAKQYLATLLETVGEVQVSYEVLGKSLQADLRMTPTEAVTVASDRQQLGLLGQMAERECLLEVFWNTPSQREIRTCLLKLFLVQNDGYNQAKANQQKLLETELPMLWIVTTSISEALRKRFGAQLKPSNGWCAGVFWLTEGFHTAIVAINQLPPTPETLWLRLLGRGATLTQAISELQAFPKLHPLRRKVLELLVARQRAMEKQKQLSTEDKELLMRTVPDFLKLRDEMLLEERQEGRSEVQRVLVETLLKSRFGTLDNTLAKVVEPLLGLSPEEAARWLLELSRPELVAKFGKTAAPAKIIRPLSTRKRK
jgi:hypothetical protein